MSPPFIYNICVFRKVVNQMRLRNVKNAYEILTSSFYFVENPKDYKNNLSSLFLTEQPIHLEIGCGKGQFLIGMAKKYPEINFIGIEKYDSVLVRAIQKCQEEDLHNLKFFCMDAKEILDVFHHDIETLYLNFSDPWPKNRHHERRLTSTTFLTLYESIFCDTLNVIQKTDNPILFASSLEDFSKNGYILSNVSLNLHETEIENVNTEYEDKFVKLGQPIYYLKAIKKK